MVGNKKVYYSIPYFINVVQWLDENVIIMCGNGLQQYWNIKHSWVVSDGTNSAKDDRK